MNPDSPMEPDKFQQAWQAHTSQTRVTINAEVLLKEVQRSQRNFQAVIFRRDFLEVGVSLLMIPVWFYLGAITSSPWTWYLTVPVLVWIAGFMLVDRIRHKQKPSEPDTALLQCVKESLTQLEHQIWLLRNIFWWYLLPPSISIMIFFAHVFWLASSAWWEFLVSVLIGGLGLFVFYASIYFLNQRAVRTQLEPRRQELLTLLASLRDETTGEVSGEYPILMSGESVKYSPSPRRMLFALLCFVTILLIGVPGIFFIASSIDENLNQGFPKKSPFAAVRWQQSQPEVKVGDDWFKLVSLDELPASEIVAFSRRTYGNKWRKRFEEDLVEVLTGMGHAPKETVQLVVKPLGSSTTRTLENVPMTRANREGIRDAAQARERSESEQGCSAPFPAKRPSLFGNVSTRSSAPPESSNSQPINLDDGKYIQILWNGGIIKRFTLFRGREVIVLSMENSTPTSHNRPRSKVHCSSSTDHKIILCWFQQNPFVCIG